MELSGLSNVLAALEKLKRKYYEGKPPEVVVGYTQRYALYVHERQARHKTGKWKYLTGPAKQLNNSGELRRNIVMGVKAGAKLNLVLLRAGMRIQGKSQKEVPFDTGALKASAFTAYHYEVEGKSRAAFNRGEAVRKAKLAERAEGKKR